MADDLKSLKPHEIVDLRLDRLERAVTTLAWWLVSAQTGFGEQDARGIEKILLGEKDED